ncbi:hypothetical protein [Lacimicrobium alkaliphilum]|uniref:Uncharacterized protein n=1 Tax=Lacimicrobium alkaliphilum TaxID=1526571 RepID=A0A0U3AVV8_9ALTE|nr:hypothetical protein [Lacimicrobium alkaliphilum]ALS98223.1 hypothetical protein AT746_08140 [Lacimicrobium alkaliphilum]
MVKKVKLIVFDCRCGGEPKGPEPVPGCHDRWRISCAVALCEAMNTGQGKEDVIKGWNRLSSSFYR